MRATLIYNTNSGGTDQYDPETLTNLLREAGFDPVYQATSSEADIGLALAGAEGLVVSAGGDGTARAVATRLIGRDLKLALIPLGTANNIARTLGISGNPQEIIAGLADPTKVHFDIGRVISPWGEDYFMEAFGFGLYSDGLEAYDPEKGKSVLRSINAIAQILPGYEAHAPTIHLDGEDFTYPYLLFEVLNTTSFGPRIKLAPQADPGDGWFEVVGIREDNRDGFLNYVTRLVAEGLDELPSVETRRAKCIEIDWKGDFPFHVDGEVRPPDRPVSPDQEPATGLMIPSDHEGEPSGTELEGMVRVEILHKAIEFWLPKPAEDTEASPPSGRESENSLPESKEPSG